MDKMTDGLEGKRKEGQRQGKEHPLRKFLSKRENTRLDACNLTTAANSHINVCAHIPLVMVST